MCKKAICIMLSLLFIVALTIPSFAAKPKSTECNFSITETVSANGQVVRTYRKANQSLVSNTGSLCNETEVAPHSEVVDLLLALGVNGSVISNMSENELDQYSSASMITTTVSYIKTTSNGVSSYVSENTARSAAADINRLLNTTSGAVAENTLIDSYMELTYVIALVGSDRFSHSVSATWLTMPTFRFKDSLGICTQAHTVIPASCQGTISYDYSMIVNGTVSSPTHHSYALTNFQTPSEEGIEWGAAAVIFDVPANAGSPGGTSMYTGLTVTFYVESHPTYPSLECYFLSTATYAHSIIAPTWPNVSISTNSGLNIVSMVGFTDELRTVSFDTPIHYVPGGGAVLL